MIIPKCPICKSWFPKKSYRWYPGSYRGHILVHEVVCRNIECRHTYLPHAQEMRMISADNWCRINKMIEEHNLARQKLREKLDACKSTPNK